MEEINTEVLTGKESETVIKTDTEVGKEKTGAEENITVFSKFLSDLFGGKKEDKSEDDDKTKEEEKTKKKETKVEAKSYSEDDLKKTLEAEKTKWLATQKEVERIAKLPPDEQIKAETEKSNQEITSLKAQLLQKTLKDDAITELSKEGYPIALAGLVNYESAESMKSSLKEVKETFKGGIELALKDRLKGKTPNGLYAGKETDKLRSEIAKNIRGGI